MQLVVEYESAGNLEMAYLARWAIIEKLVKVVTSEYRKDSLRKAVAEWMNFLGGEGGKRPSLKLNTTLDLKVLPEKNEFNKALSYFGLDATLIWSVMDSEGKPRRRRNEIAHTGKRFGRDSSYRDLSKLVQDVVNIPLRFRP